MFALVDAISFYASAEKVFDPSIRNKPVVVLTNNDGCICAVCPIARNLGVPKFVPYFKIRSFLHKHGVVVRSSNYELYADLSERMMNVIARYCDNQYVYSIDESFLEFKHYNRLIKDWHQYGHEIRRAVWKETRLPVGVGFGTTATLAKAANHAAKKLSGYDGVAIIDSEQSRKAILTRMDVTDVWGIGRQHGKKLNTLDIKDGWQVANMSKRVTRNLFGVVGERLLSELNGNSCLSWDEIKSPKQAIFSTRSFGTRVTEYPILQSALITHGAIVGRKLRQQNSVVKKLMIFAASSPHDEHYFKTNRVCEFVIATDNTLELASAISQAMLEIYKCGIQFYRCGVGAIEIQSKQFQQGDLFETDKANPQLMISFDAINHRYGQDTVAVASQGQPQHWQMKRHFLSPQYTSCWRDIPKIEC